MTLFAGISFFYLVVVLVGSLFPGDRMARSFRNRARWSAAVLKALGIVVEIMGTVPQGGHLYVSNHRSYIDICVVLKYIHASIVAKAEVGKWPIIGMGARATYTVMIQRDSPESRKNTRVQVQQVLGRGYSVVIFPEGTTFDGPGVKPYRPGPFQIAEGGNFTLVPVALEYEHTEDAWVGDDTFVAHFLKCFQKPVTKVKMSIGSSIAPGPWQQTHDAAQQWAQQETLRLRAKSGN